MIEGVRNHAETQDVRDEVRDPAHSNRSGRITLYAILTDAQVAGYAIAGIEQLRQPDL